MQWVYDRFNVITEEPKLYMPPEFVRPNAGPAKWKFMGREFVSHIRYLTDTDVIILLAIGVIVILVVSQIIFVVYTNDMYTDGYMDGLTSEILKMVKIKSCRQSEPYVEICTIPDSAWLVMSDGLNVRKGWISKFIKYLTPHIKRNPNRRNKTMTRLVLAWMRKGDVLDGSFLKYKGMTLSELLDQKDQLVQRMKVPNEEDALNMENLGFELMFLDTLTNIMLNSGIK